MISGQTGDELIAHVKRAMEMNGLVIFLFHGVGGEHNLDVSLEAHRALLSFLKQHEGSVWVAPVAEIAGFIREHRKEK